MLGIKNSNKEDDEIYRDKTKTIYDYIKELNEDEINKLLENRINDICEIIIKDKSRNDMNYCGRFFSKMPPDILKNAIQYISENSEKIKIADYSINIGPDLIKMFINNISEEIVKEKSEALKKIINDTKSDEDLISDMFLMFGEKKETESSKALDMIDFICNKELSYEKMKKTNIQELVEGDNKEKFENLLDYGINKDKYPLVNDDYISDLYQASYNNSVLDNIKNKFEVFKSNSEKPEMDKYEQEVSTLTDMDKTQFDNFIEDIKKLKSCEGTIPEKYCDFLMKQKLNSESILNQNLEKYWPVFKRVFEDKTRHILSGYGIDNYIVQVTNELNEKTLGEQGIKFIRFDEQQIKDLSEKNMDSLDTLFHEARHAYQNKRMYRDKKYSSVQYKMLKEDIIMKEKTSFYKDNYLFMYREIDARIHGKIGAYKYLKQLGFSNKRILRKDGKDFFECYNENQKLERKAYEVVYKKVDENNKEREINEMFDEILEQNPDLIKKYPVLSIEYDENCERRSCLSLLEDYEKSLSNAKLNPGKQNDNKLMIIPSILEDVLDPIKDTIIYKDKIIKDSEKLLEYNTDNKIVKKYRDLIIKNEILMLLIKEGSDRTIYVYEDDTDEQARDNYNRIVGNLKRFAIKNPEEKISKDILKIIKKQEKDNDIDSLKNIDNSVKPEERNEGKAVIKVINKSKNDKNIAIKVDL